ncbi:hypothetical protein [Alteromonas flava]|uniref:hypothetical protein n=1 Tax=Alteromonas flava TaxID=2048003 RepID=UPI001F0B74F3|nr:hypothetical protein [Alteromonas flava]
MTETNRYKSFEGGAVYTGILGGKYLVVLDESTLTDFIDDDAVELVMVIEFDSESKRDAYLQHRFG